MDKNTQNKTTWGTELFKKYEFSGKLQRRKFTSHLFIMILTNLSTLLIVNVDAIMVGNFSGENSFNSVNLLYPFTLVINALASLLSQGIGVVAAKVGGMSEETKKNKIYKSIVYLTVAFTIGITIIQFPGAYLMIENYDISDNIKDLVWKYAQGMFIVNSVGIFSGVCTNLLIASGQSKKLMNLAFIEGITNLVLDYLFVGVFGLGVTGAGFASAIACSTRAIFAVIIVLKTFKFFPVPKVKCREECIEIIQSGIPAMASSLVVAIQLYAMNNIIVEICGMEGITARSVALFMNSVAMVLINSIVQSTNPLMGIAVGSEDWLAITNLSRFTLAVCGILMLGCTAFALLCPDLLFNIYGLDEFTAFEIGIVQIFCLQFIFKGLNNVLRNILVFLEKKTIATVATFLEMAVLVVPLALLFSKISRDALFYSYTVAGAIVTIILGTTYVREMKKRGIKIWPFASLSISFSSNTGVDASERLHEYFRRLRVPEKLANRISLAVEELSAYVENKGKKNEDVNISLFIKVYKDKLILFYLDDGEPVLFEKKNDSPDRIITNNYELVEKLAKSMKYQTICGMNNFILEFDLNKF